MGKCRIHPTAVVEASWIGDNVIIGANAVVRGSVLADNVRIEDLALVECSILDAGAVVQRQAMVKFSILRMKSSVAGVMQLGVMDTSSSLKRGGCSWICILEKKTQVIVDGELQDAPIGLAGCFVGKNTQVGLGVRVAPGRMLPADLIVTADVSGVLQKIPADLERTSIGVCFRRHIESLWLIGKMSSFRHGFGTGYVVVLTFSWSMMIIGVRSWGRNWMVQKPTDLPEKTPLLSICIPARNEEENIAACVDAALQSSWPNLGVVVVDDRSTDQTRAQALKAANGDPRFVLISGEEPALGWAGKPWTCSRAAKESKSWLLFVDADVLASRGCHGSSTSCGRASIDLLSWELGVGWIWGAMCHSCCGLAHSWDCEF